jgi:hypothetical protein
MSIILLTLIVSKRKTSFASKEKNLLILLNIFPFASKKTYFALFCFTFLNLLRLFHFILLSFRVFFASWGQWPMKKNYAAASPCNAHKEREKFALFHSLGFSLAIQQ